MSDAMIECRGLSVDLGGQPILRDVDLSVRGGELVVLVGPNGAGKSTLLAALAGDVTLSAGEVLLGGRRLSSYSAKEAARMRAVQVQHQGLAFGFEVQDVVAMGRAPWHRTPAADLDEEVVVTSIARAQITHLAERLFPTLSGGEQARTSFARALAQETQVLLLDEPTAALDVRHQEALLTEARRVARAGGAVVVVLHDLSLAAAYADRICVLSAGRLRADGAPREVLSADLLSEVYQHPVDVIEHGGHPVVIPARAARDDNESVAVGHVTEERR